MNSDTDISKHLYKDEVSASTYGERYQDPLQEQRRSLPEQTPLIRVFLSSPGDVIDERNLARQLLNAELPREPALRGRVSFEPVSWEDPAARVAMIANETPQASVNRALPRPGECDFVAVILWTRMGTPLPRDILNPSTGEPYISGTEWEYQDAVNSSRKPKVLVYKRTEMPQVYLNDPDLDDKQVQLRKVEDFLKRFKNPDGSLSGGINTYTTPSEFKELLRQHIMQFVWERIDPKSTAVSGTAVHPRWEGSPFPGLRAFTTADAPIFFGRGQETDTLIKKFIENRFVAVVGASGSGKSSLVGAGLIPRLEGDAISGSKDWLLPEYDTQTRRWKGLRFTPAEVSENPFTALATQLAPLVDKPPREVAYCLESNFGSICDYVAEAAPHGERRPAALLFVDQFEELFTLCTSSLRKVFIDFLDFCSRQDFLRIVLTLRSDFYQNCVDYAPLAKLLEKGSFPLSSPTDTLHEMLVQPAHLACLSFEEGLPGRILRDTGSEPGGLALLAYTLDELYRRCREYRKITRAAYEALGGVQGAIGHRAEETYAKLASVDRLALERVFRELVSVDESGNATRRRASLNSFRRDPPAQRLIEVFAEARLLTLSNEKQPVVEVAHEAIFRSWDWLRNWILQEQEDLILLRQVRQAATLWGKKGRADSYLWSGDRLKEAEAVIERQSPILSSIEREFVRSEVDRMVDIVNDPGTTHFQRAEIGDRLALIGDTRSGVGLTSEGLPHIAWCKVQDHTKAFYIAQYPITYIQYRSFLEAKDGFNVHRYGLPGEQYRRIDNCPAENVSFDDANGFCQWLTSQLSYEVRLPTEDEWELAARGGHTDYQYPWGKTWHPDYANTSDSRLVRTTAVGMYPLGSASCGASDMSGNVWEWTCSPGPQGDEHILRGGSWLSSSELARISSKRPQRNHTRGNMIGFRPVSYPLE